VEESRPAPPMRRRFSPLPLREPSAGTERVDRDFAFLAAGSGMGDGAIQLLTRQSNILRFEIELKPDGSQGIGAVHSFWPGSR